MNEMIFLVEEDPEGGYNAKALGENIITQGDTMKELKEMIIDAIDCHFDDASLKPKMVRLHFVKEELFALA
jgi:predicted RNase H-like HicB family nuclease